MNLKTSFLLILLCFAAACSSSSSDSPNATPNTPLSQDDLFNEILKMGAGSYTGDCLSVSTGQPAPGTQITLSENGALSNPEFTSDFKTENSTLSFSQERSPDNSSIVKSEWSGANFDSTTPDTLLLRFNTNGIPSDNLAHAKIEIAMGNDKGSSCIGASTQNLVSYDLDKLLKKYITEPKFHFNICACSPDANTPPAQVPADLFQSTGDVVFLAGYSLDISVGHKTSAIVLPPNNTQRLIYTIQPSGTNTAVFSFDQNLVLNKFVLHLDSGGDCTCTE